MHQGEVTWQTNSSLRGSSSGKGLRERKQEHLPYAWEPIGWAPFGSSKQRGRNLISFFTLIFNGSETHLFADLTDLFIPSHGFRKDLKNGSRDQGIRRPVFPLSSLTNVTWGEPGPLALSPSVRASADCPHQELSRDFLCTLSHLILFQFMVCIFPEFLHSSSTSS